MTSSSTVPKHILVSSPGKVILHGEHAVVYGKSAIATSVDLRCYVLVAPNSSSGEISLTLPGMQLNKAWNVHEIANLPIATEEGVEHFKRVCNVGASEEPSMQQLASIILLYLLTEVYKDRLKTLSGLEVIVVSELPFGAGLGSSAAYSVCLAAGLMASCGLISFHNTLQPSSSIISAQYDKLPPLLRTSMDSMGLSNSVCDYPRFSDETLEEINRLAFDSEKIVHGTPSGIDNSISTFGGAILFKNGIFNPLVKMPNLTVLVVHTKIVRSTKRMVSNVREKHTTYPHIFNPLLDSIESIVANSKSALEELWTIEDMKIADGGAVARKERLYATLWDMFSVNHHLLNALGVGHASLDTVYRIASDNGCMCKTTGAGGGGCALVLLPPGIGEEHISKVLLEMSAAGFECWRTSIGSKGVALHCYC